MSSYEGIKAHMDEEYQEGEVHAWVIDLDIIVGKHCCNGPMIRPRKLMLTNDLSESNEDRYVQAAEEAVRQAFDFARRHTRMDRLLKDAGHDPLRPRGGGGGS
jgi:hypothetical protein